ncbi:FecR/PupR family sigma factor regulator [Pseudomonas qingdaonensis]|nr:FecR/PupR family sigma factor regulator [Pseudomonas qingdaonensis]
MSRFARIDNQPLDPGVVEQAMLWMVTLQSGVSSLAEQQACQHWRNENPPSMNWPGSVLPGSPHDLRQGTRTLPAAGARGLLQARGTASRRNVPQGFAGLGWYWRLA